MGSSIRMRLFRTFIVILLITEIGLVFLSNLFLDDVIVYANKVLIRNIYEEYNLYFKLEEIDQDKLTSIASKNDVGIVIYENEIKACNSLFICKGENPEIPTYISNFFPSINENEGKPYPLNYDTLNIHQLVYIFNLGDGRYLIIDKSLTPIQEINQIIRPILYFTGFFVFFLGSIAIYFTSKRISNPIIEISEYGNDLANLKFDEKLQINQKDEIGKLATSMNLISEKLNNALNELKEDLEKEKELDKKRVKFFSSVSHEFKTPLTIIQGYAEGLKHNIAKSKEDISDYCDIIIYESKKMGHFVNDLLNLSLYESDNFILNKADFDIVELVTSTAEKFKDAWLTKKINFKINGIKNYIVNADFYRIEQVINNLISNAVKFVDENGVIEINIEGKSDSVALYFFNNGEKIDEKDINNIWSLFYKLEESKNRIGTGIGLAIVKSIVELHNGKYGVENKENGVEFYIEIPK